VNATGNGNARSRRDGKTGSSARAPSEPKKGPVTPRAPLGQDSLNYDWEAEPNRS